MQEWNEEVLNSDETELVSTVIQLIHSASDEWFIDYTSPTGVHLLRSTWGSIISLHRDARKAHIVEPYITELSDLNSTRLFDCVMEWEDEQLDIVSNRNVFNEPYNDPKAHNFERRLFFIIISACISYLAFGALIVSLHS